MRKILFPYDGSESAKRTLEYIKLLKQEYTNLEVHVLHVQDSPKLFGDYVSTSLLDQIRDETLKHAQDVSSEAHDKLIEEGISSHTHAELGDVAMVVSRKASELECDTIVMGTRGLGNLANLVMGSVATRVVHESKVPVLLVK